MKPYRLTKRGLYFGATIHVLTLFVLAGFVGALEHDPNAPTLVQVLVVAGALFASWLVQRFWANSTNWSDFK